MTVFGTNTALGVAQYLNMDDFAEIFTANLICLGQQN
jgi:hypothetical protein